MKKKIIVIVGPTGSGKTKLSIEIAKQIHAEIINGDSVQVYKELNIGSAKIKEHEKQGIAHHLFDFIDPKHTYSVFDFQKDAREKIKSIDVPMIVGGTGLYIKSVLYDYEFKDQQRNASFEKQFEHMSNLDLHQYLMTLDPNIQIDINNRRRVLRALEQAKSGHKRSLLNKKDHLIYPSLVLYLDLPKDELESRLIHRLNQQFEEGFIEEVTNLRKKGIFHNAIGYKEINDYLDGKTTLEETKALILKSSKRLAKKQKTFFKNQMDVHFLNANDPNLLNQALELINTFLEAT